MNKASEKLARARVRRFCHHCLYGGVDNEGIMTCNQTKPTYAIAAVCEERCAFSNIAFDNGDKGKLIRKIDVRVPHGGVMVYPLEHYRLINDLTYAQLKGALFDLFSFSWLWNVCHGVVPHPILMTKLVEYVGRDYKDLW
jgi:hypothetical protein